MNAPDTEQTLLILLGQFEPKFVYKKEKKTKHAQGGTLSNACKTVMAVELPQDSDFEHQGPLRFPVREAIKDRQYSCLDWNAGRLAYSG